MKSLRVAMETRYSLGAQMGQLGQVLSRLFPFKRGLVHAYWAANAWALYIAGDKAVAIATRTPMPPASMTGGVVGEAVHVLLPAVSPPITGVVTLVAMLVCVNRMHVPCRFLK